MKGTYRKTKIVFVLYIALLILLLLLFLLYARKSLILYEASQPTVIMEDIRTRVASSVSVNFADTITDLCSDIQLSLSEYETTTDYLSILEASIANNGLSYEKIHEDYATGALTYALSTNGQAFAEAVLTPTNTMQRMIVLTISDYSFTDFTLLAPSTPYSVTVTMPESYSVSINGVKVTSDHSSDVTVDPLLVNCSDYIMVPGEVTLTVDGLFEEPEVAIYMSDGLTVVDAACVSGNTPEAFLYEVSYVTTAPSAELTDFVLDCVETYSNFFSKDLEGCQNSVDPIRHLFPEDSIYLTLADQYRREDMGVFASHTNTHFLNEKVSEYTIYNENCYSVRVTFDKSMTLGSGKEVIDTTDNIYYFINVNGNWVIADIQ